MNEGVAEDPRLGMYRPTLHFFQQQADPHLCLFSMTIIDDFRLFAGDLGNEVTDELLTKTFSKYPSFLKAKVVRDKKTQKCKGYGFISFAEPDDFARAWKEMNGNKLMPY